MSGGDPGRETDAWARWAVARDAILLGAGVFIGISLAFNGRSDPALVALAMGFAGTGAYGRGVAGKDRRDE